MQEFNEDVTIYNNIAVGGSVSAESISLAGQDIIRAVASALWPVGSIYMTISSTNPSGQFGGTWVAWGTGRVPVGVDTTQTEFNMVESTGGDKYVILTINEIPAHIHPVQTPNGVAGNSALNIPGIDFTANQVGVSFGLRTAANGTRIEYDKSGTEYNTDQPHGNLQPYITCYMWKRVA